MTRLYKTSQFGRRVLRLGLIAVIGLMGLSACGPAAPVSSGQVVTLRFSTWGSAEEITVTRRLVQAFERQHPGVRVELMHIPDNYFQKLHILIASGMTPDVVFLNSQYLPVYATHGIFADLGGLLQPGQALTASGFFAPALRALQWQGRQMALPRDVSNLVVFYNRDWLERAGLPLPRAGWTFADFLRTARRVTADDNGDGRPDRFGTSFYSQPPLFWLPFVWSAGGALLDTAGRRVMLGASADGGSHRPGIDGLAFYSDLRNRHHVAPTRAQAGSATMTQMFLQQRVALLVSGRWIVPVLRKQAAFDWDVAPFPAGPGGSRVGVDASGYAVSAASRHPRQARALVAFLLSRPSVQAVTASGLIIPARRDVARSSVFLAAGQRPAHAGVFLDALATGVPTPAVPRWNEFSEALGLALEPVWDGRQSPQTAMAGVTPALNRLLTPN